jgi:hypothetical protein
MKISLPLRQAQLEKVVVVVEMLLSLPLEPELLEAVGSLLGPELLSAKLSQDGKQMETEVPGETFL